MREIVQNADIAKIISRKRQKENLISDRAVAFSIKISNSQIIHQVQTNEIITVTVLAYIFYVFISTCSPKFKFD